MGSGLPCALTSTPTSPNISRVPGFHHLEHPSIFLAEMSVYIICPFLKLELFVFLSFENSLYILDRIPLSDK